MCGISGIIRKDNKPVNSADIQSINDIISHRGPDSEGFYHQSNFSFGHRRLSIIGLGEEGYQPMLYNNKYSITFNGEIYNYIEIRKELESFEYTFKTTTDTEVILAAYDKWGEECVSKFNGMWAFALHDSIKNTIFCSRDRFGIKPFYYTENKDQFIFGSEIKQLLHFFDKPKVNKSTLLDYIIIGFEEHKNETFFEGILKLAPGHNLIYNLDNHKLSIKKYYHINLNPSNSNEEEAINQYKEKLTNAIKLRMRSDVKVGTCLSGGLDSSSVAAIASSIYATDSDDKFNAIHAKSSEIESDESHFAKAVANHCNLQLNNIEPTIEEFRNNIDEIIYTQEEPFGSPSIFMQYFVMKKAKEINCKVMLDGQGGDETLLGYEKYYPAYLLGLGGAKMIKEFFNSSKNSKLSKIDLFKYIFYFTKYSIRIKRLRQKNAYLKSSILDSFNSATLKNLSNSYLDVNKLQLFEIEKTQLPHLLRYEDKNSMRNSIETRLPFIDYQVLEQALSTKNELKIKDGWTKYILRKTIDKLLPKEIVWRKNKLGFNAPENKWMDSIEGEIIGTIKESNILTAIVDFDKLKIKSLDNRTKWKLFNVAKWEKIYNVSIN